MRTIVPFLKDAWSLAQPYFRSEEKWTAWLLLLAIIAMNLAMVGMDVVLNFWNGAFYDALQNKDWRSFVELLFFYRSGAHGGFMPGFSGIAVVYILISVYTTYITQWLQIRWRRWLTGQYLTEWLADRAYYRISLTGGKSGTGTDNPDQRIADDLRSFVGDTLSLGIGLLSNIVELASFIGILWGLSGAARLFGIHIPGYMVWVALIYAIVGTWLTHLVGRPLARLSFLQQRYEADFRFSLVRLRENVEGVALYGGEAEERGVIAGRFGGVMTNWWAIMQRTKLLNVLTSGYQQVAVVFPFIVAAPRYFSGQMALGGLTRTASAFGQVQGAMSWFVSSYASLAAYWATVERLATFHRAIVAARAASGEGVAAGAGVPSADGLSLAEATITLPDGQPLLAQQSLSLSRGESVVIGGRSGSGKSTLFRAIAGIWPFGAGVLTPPAGRRLFLPQRPYIPLGTLRHAIAYPEAEGGFDDATIAAALTASGLAGFAGRLDEDANWAQTLSGGEQQRLAIARALLIKPDWLFLDEATASLDPESESALYLLLKRELPATTIVSIAHRASVAAFHDRHLRIERPDEAPGRITEAAKVAG